MKKRWDWKTLVRGFAAPLFSPKGMVAALAAILFLLIFRFVAGSDFRELALNRFQDDSYYYLQPAWQFLAKGFFTFDGLNPTYGFQPLWMLVLAVQAVFTPDKIDFIRMAALLGGGFYCLAGVALFYLSRTWLPGWRAVIAPAFWLANPPLASLYITGKENALYAFLLIAAAAIVARTADGAWSRRSAFATGIITGLMMLARVNALVPAALLLGVLFAFEGGGWRGKWARLSWTALGIGAMVIPWAIYAQVSFGTVFPNSGSAKLIGGWAGAAVAVHAWLPWMPASVFNGALPATEKIFFAHPDSITIPTLDIAKPFFLDYLPDLSMGFWKDEVLGHVMPYRAKFILLVSAVILVSGWIAMQCLRLRRKLTRFTSVSPSTQGAAVLAALLLAAGLNGLANWFLLPAYLYWASWYAVPETIAFILLAATAFGVLADWLLRVAPPKWKWGAHVSMAALAVAAFAIGAIRTVEGWAPVAYDPARNVTQAEVYTGVLWMNDHIPARTRVGSFSAGLLGYFAKGFTVINLDGLANTPEFVATLLPKHILYARELAPDTPLRQYLLDSGITYLANYDPLDRIQSRNFMGLVNGNGSRLLFLGTQDIIWGPGEPVRRFGVVEITP
jgi:hypothetical protein